MTARNAAGKLSKSMFAATFGVSESQLERLFQQGMPHAKKGRRIEIPMPAGRVWYHTHLVDKGKRQAAPRDMDEARRRKMAAEAELAELELAKARDELMTVEAFDRAVLDAFSRVDVRLQNLASRLAGAVLGAQTIQESQARIDPLVEEAREELRRADDVPPTPEDDDDDDDDVGAAAPVPA